MFFPFIVNIIVISNYSGIIRVWPTSR
ncbi:hypothetical protein LCGC14_1149740, partial [marine sediment metagenome]